MNDKGSVREKLGPRLRQDRQVIWQPVVGQNDVHKHRSSFRKSFQHSLRLDCFRIAEVKMHINLGKNGSEDTADSRKLCLAA